MNRKIYGYIQPFDMEYEETKKGDLWFMHGFNKNLYHHQNTGMGLPKEIVEKWEPEYEKIKLEELPKKKWEELIKEYKESKYSWGEDFIKEAYPNGLVIIPKN